MKKIVLMFAIAVAFAACNNESETGADSISADSTTGGGTEKMTGTAGAPKMDDSTVLLGDTSHMHTVGDTAHKH